MTKKNFNPSISNKQKEQQYQESSQWSTKLELGSVGSAGQVFNTKVKKQQQDSLQNDIEAFLSSGGNITILPDTIIRKQPLC